MTKVIYYIKDILQRFGDLCNSLMNITIEEFLPSLELPVDIPVITPLWHQILESFNNFLSRFGANEYPLLFGILSVVLLGLFVFITLKFVFGFVGNLFHGAIS